MTVNPFYRYGGDRISMVTPFTYRDGISLLQLIEELRTYVARVAIPELNKMFEELDKELQENFNENMVEMQNEINSFTDATNQTINNFIQQVNELVASINNRVGPVEVQHLTLTSDTVVSVNPLWPDNQPVVFRVVQDEVGGHAVSFDRSNVPVSFTPNSETVFHLIPDGDGGFDLYQPRDSVVNILDYGARCDGLTDDTAAIALALSNVADGGTVTAPTGAHILVSGVVVDKSVNMDFATNTVIQGANSPAFLLHGEYEDIQQCAVSGRSVSVTNGSAYKYGDIVKIVSDDVNPTARPMVGDSKARLGSHYFVEGVLGNVLTIDREPILSLSTNPRIGKMTERKINLSVGDIFCSEENQNSFTAHSVTAIGLAEPSINVTVSRGGGAGVALISCYRANVNARVRELLDVPGVHNGYGVSDIASTFSDVTIDAHRVRHAYTDDTPNTVSGSTLLENFGYSEKALIRGRSISSFNSAFDTHHGGFFHVFESVTVTRSSGQAFGLRGTGHQLNNPNVDSFRGVNVFFESASPSVTKKHIINGGYFRVNEALNVTEHVDNYDESETLTVVGTVFEVKSRILQTANANVRFVAPTFITYETTKPPVLIDLYGGRLTGSFTFTAKNVVNGEPSAFANIGSKPADVDVDAHIDITEEYSNLLTRFAQANGGRFAARITGSKDVGSLSGSLNDHRQAFTARYSDSVASSAMIETPIVDGSSLPQPKSSDPVIFVVVTMPNDNNMNYAQPGAFAGQMMVVQNSVESEGTLAIQTTGNILVDALTTIVPGESVLLMFNGTNWRKMNFK